MVFVLDPALRRRDDAGETSFLWPINTLMLREVSEQ